MPPNFEDDVETLPYTWNESNDNVVFRVKVKGHVSQDDLAVYVQSDIIYINSQAGEKWKLKLTDPVDFNSLLTTTVIDSEQNLTTINISLTKKGQETENHQDHLNHCTSKTFETNNDVINSILRPEFGHLETRLTKKTAIFHQLAPTDVNYSLVLSGDIYHLTIFINHIYDIDVKLAENCFSNAEFLIIFRTEDEHFLEQYFISADIPVHLVLDLQVSVRSNKYTYEVKPACVEIIFTDGSSSEFIPNPSEADGHHISFNEQNSILSINYRPRTVASKYVNMFPQRYGLWSFNAYDNRDRSERLEIISEEFSNIYSTSDRKLLLHESIDERSTESKYGLTGIYNSKNSCFMNAVLQCFSNTRELRDYFLQSYHYADVNRENPLGMGGLMAMEFDNIIKSLWNEKHSYIDASKLRECLGKKHQEFIGYGQHDAQELLTVLLDGLHEDLNRVKFKPQVPPIEDSNIPNYILADKYWQGYLSRNDSIIVQLFTGQFKSHVTCTQCQKESVIFEPFTSISAPIPMRIVVDVTVMRRNHRELATKYSILIPANSVIQDLKNKLTVICDLAVDKMCAYSLTESNVVKYMDNNDRIMKICSESYVEPIYIREILTSSECTNEKVKDLIFYHRVFKPNDYIRECAYCRANFTIFNSPESCKICYSVSYCDKTCQLFDVEGHQYDCNWHRSNGFENIGTPLIISVPESKLTCDYVFKQINTNAKETVDVTIRSKQTQNIKFSYPTIMLPPYLYRQSEANQKCSESADNQDFSDITSTDWTLIKGILGTLDSWSICRIGDYLVQSKRNKKNSMNTATNDDDNDESDMFKDTFDNQKLYRLTPKAVNHVNDHVTSIVDIGEENDKILRSYDTFFIDWYTDNATDSLLQVHPSYPSYSSESREGINNIIQDPATGVISARGKYVSLDECMQSFTEREILSANDTWYCSNCKEHIQAEKQISIWRLPPILIIHLKRFKYNEVAQYSLMFSGREKIDTSVKYPLYGLDMTPYCSSHDLQSNEQTNTNAPLYNLYGVIKHSGTLSSGHYTSCAQLLSKDDPNITDIGWRYFNDESVSEIDNMESVIQPEAYVLFYRHHSFQINFPIRENIENMLVEPIGAVKPF